MDSEHHATDEGCEAELGFFAAMHAYRAAKNSGDKEATQKAEDAWRERVRAELMGQPACETRPRDAFSDEWPNM